jgi:hypothetical protein
MDICGELTAATTRDQRIGKSKRGSARQKGGTMQQGPYRQFATTYSYLPLPLPSQHLLFNTSSLLLLSLLLFSYPLASLSGSLPQERAQRGTAIPSMLNMMVIASCLASGS